MRTLRQRFSQLFDSNGQPADVWVPLLKATVIGAARSVRVDMLVDSGATETILGESLANAVGIPIGREEVELVGMGGSLALGRVASATLEFGLGRYRFKSRLVVAPDFESHHALLGMRDFFLCHRVVFQADERWFSVTPVGGR